MGNATDAALIPINAETRVECELIFVRRQSPDWARLSRDYRAGRAIDPARFVPDHSIPGFPDDIAILIGHWNKEFSIDFFTFRAIISSLSSKSVEAISGAHIFHFENVDDILDFARNNRSLVYFHDDDDFFSPDIGLIRDHVDEDVDVVVTPLLRVGIPVFTFVRPGHDSDVVIGEKTDFHFRFQTNNYALNGSRIGSKTDILTLKDHILAAAHADSAPYSEIVVDRMVSGTIKTPASASMMPGVLEAKAGRWSHFTDFLAATAAVNFPSTCDWIARPLESIVRTIEAIDRGEGAGSIADLLDFEASR